MKRGLQSVSTPDYHRGECDSAAATFFSLAEWVALLLDSCLEVQLLALLLRLSKKTRSMVGDYLRAKESLFPLEPLLHDIYSYKKRFRLTHIHSKYYVMGTGCLVIVQGGDAQGLPVSYCLPGRFGCLQGSDVTRWAVHTYEYASLTASYVLGEEEKEDEPRTIVARHIYEYHKWDGILLWHAVADILCLLADQDALKMQREKRNGVAFLPCDRQVLML
jgi:hypothetical protein